MSDFFAGVYGARFPDVVINGGGNPLPGMGGLPRPLHDTPDAKINYNNSLLGNLEPYAYGEPGYLSSQTSYLNIPHKIQKIVPTLYLPEPDGTGSFPLYHPIDDGDIVFAMRLDRNSEVCTNLNNRNLHRSGLGTAIDPMINLCTLNYILAGVQICTQVDTLRAKWDQLLHYLDAGRFPGHRPGVQHNYTFEDLQRIVRHLIRPFGVAHGSEKQGGQHEGSLAPVTWPVSFVISLTLDGKEANMVNIWHKHNVEAGNDLVLRLKPVPLPPSRKYTLNHYPKGLVEKMFSSNVMSQVFQAVGVNVTHVWQLVPDIFSFDVDPGLGGLGLVPSFIPAAYQPYWQQAGFWHIAKAQIHCKQYGVEEYYYNDLANNLRTGHMDSTFQPTYFAIPFRDPVAQGGPAVQFGGGRNVFNALGERAALNKREWRGTLRIEQGFGDAGAGMGPGAGSSGGGGGNVANQFADNGAKRVRYDSESFVQMIMPSSQAESRHQPIVPLRIASDAPVAAGAGMSGWTEDIGLFDEAPSLVSRSASMAADASADALRPITSSSLSIPKPALKGAKRGPARGKGVTGAVLASDGSVRHEPSLIL